MIIGGFVLFGIIVFFQKKQRVGNLPKLQKLNLPSIKKFGSWNSWKSGLIIIAGIAAVYILLPHWNEFWRNRRIAHTMEEIRINQQFGTIPTHTAPISSNYMKYSKSTFTSGVAKHYNRGFVAEYFYPAEPNVTFTLRFQDDNDPSSHWDYRVTTGPDGAIIGEQRLDDHDKRHSGSHSVTLLSSDVPREVVYSDKPPQ